MSELAKGEPIQGAGGVWAAITGTNQIMHAPVSRQRTNRLTGKFGQGEPGRLFPRREKLVDAGFPATKEEIEVVPNEGRLIETGRRLHHRLDGARADQVRLILARCRRGRLRVGFGGRQRHLRERRRKERRDVVTADGESRRGCPIRRIERLEDGDHGRKLVRLTEPDEDPVQLALAKCVELCPLTGLGVDQGAGQADVEAVQGFDGLDEQGKVPRLGDELEQRFG